MPLVLNSITGMISVFYLCSPEDCRRVGGSEDTVKLTQILGSW